MIKVNGQEYISDKEAQYKYGFSQAWFKKHRSMNDGPPFVKIKGKILYSIEETEKWLKENMIKSENL